MKVTLLAHTPQPEITVAMSAKLCYSAADIDTIRDGLDEEKRRALLICSQRSVMKVRLSTRRLHSA